MVIPGEQPFMGPRSAASAESEFPCRILIVDDDEALRRSLPHVLLHPGRTFDDCGDVASAIELLSTNRYDLILLDYRLPDATGLAVLDWLAARGREEAVIMISGDAAIDAAIGALRRGADDFVRKPYHVAQLQRAVHGALHKAALERANRAMSQRLRASERLHRYLVERSPDLIFTLDAEDRFSYLNPRVEAMLGFERSYLIGRPFTSLIMPEDVDRVRALLQAPRGRRSEGFSIELRLRRNRESGVDATTPFATVSLTVIPMPRREEDGRRYVGLYGVARDISERKRAEEIIAFQAYHDQLTRLPNRVLFKDRLELAVAQAERQGKRLAVMFVDIDRFKLVNDTFGHTEGDVLLRGIASRLSATLRRGDTLARLGGDEFTILLPDIEEPEDAEIIARKVVDAVAAPFPLSEGDFRATVSIGIALYPRDAHTADDLTRHADIAMYQVKRSGRNGFRFFDPTLNVQHRHRITLENDLRSALERGELELHYQPQLSLSRRKVVGMEALLRWNHPLHGQLGPASFVPMAEEVGLIGDISRWVLEQACHQLAVWQLAGHTDLRLSINFTSHDFERDDVVEVVTGCLQRHGVPAARLELEITESMMVEDSAETASKVRELREAGVGIAIDDFGTGYSALGYLQKFPVSTLKIDRSFVRELAGTATNPIISAITGIARGFSLDLVAEGVEREEQVKTLRALGCDVLQGYLFAHPAPADEATTWLVDPPLGPLAA